MLNLLIAIVTNRYKPEEAEAETQFKQSQIVDYYLLQVCNVPCMSSTGT